MAGITRRGLVRAGFLGGLTLAVPARRVWAANANDEINVGFISCGGRSNALMGSFAKVPGVTIGGLCDPDENRLGLASKRFPKARTWTDLRDLLADDGIDAVVISTCNHWHCLAAIWAMQAGKDVYVEKPLSHSQWEGRQTVAAARKLGRICQVGTQQRSDPMQAEIKNFLHEERGLGAIKSVRVNRIGMRASIGKREKPLEIPKDVAYDLWLGPAADEPIYRDKLQYDWHWDWNTGSGEMGNWGVHVLDDVRNVVFRDSVSLPRRIQGLGGRVVWNDAGQTPNVHMVQFDTGSIPVSIHLSNLPAGPGEKKSPKHPGPGSGYVAICEGGRYQGQRGGGVAYDAAGKEIRRFKGNSGNGLHQQNFIDAVRAGDPTLLNAEVQVGNDSTGWCNLANIACRAGSRYRAETIADGFPQIGGLAEELSGWLTPFGLSLDGGEILASSILEVDPASEQFTGSGAEQANRFLKREYRDGYAVPEIS
jgi:hypothetical protein